MAKRRNLYGRKKSRFLQFVMGVTIVMSLVTVGLSASLVVMNINVYRNNKAVNEIKNNMTEMKQELSTMQEQEEEYKSQAEQLQQELSQYEPVVIPDSMKTGN